MTPDTREQEGKHYTRTHAGKQWHFLALSTSEAYVYWRQPDATHAPAQDVQTFTTSTEQSTAYSQALGAWQRASGLVKA